MMYLIKERGDKNGAYLRLFYTNALFTCMGMDYLRAFCLEITVLQTVGD